MTHLQREVAQLYISISLFIPMAPLKDAVISEFYLSQVPGVSVMKFPKFEDIPMPPDSKRKSSVKPSNLFCCAMPHVS